MQQHQRCLQPLRQKARTIEVPFVAVKSAAESLDPFKNTSAKPTVYETVNAVWLAVAVKTVVVKVVGCISAAIAVINTIASPDRFIALLLLLLSETTLVRVVPDAVKTPEPSSGNYLYHLLYSI